MDTSQPQQPEGRAAVYPLSGDEGSRECSAPPAAGSPGFPLTLSGKSGAKKRWTASSWLTLGPPKGCARASCGEGDRFVQVWAEGAPMCLWEQVQRRPPSARGRRACVHLCVCVHLCACVHLCL